MTTLLRGPASVWPRSVRKEQQVQAERVQQRAMKIASDVQELRRQLTAAKPQVNLKVDGSTVDQGTMGAGQTVQAAPTNGSPKLKHLDDMIGQSDVLMQIRTVVLGSLLRHEKMSHVLISGPAGFGKSSLGEILAEEAGMAIVPCVGMSLRKPSDVVSLLIRQTEPTVLFIDEIHAMGRPAQEALFQAMQEGVVDVLTGGSDAVATRHTIPGLVVVGATTRSGLLTQPFRDRFGLQLQLAPYAVEEISEIVRRVWDSSETPYAEEELHALAQRSKGTPRKAIHLATRVLDYMACEGSPAIQPGTVANALAVFGIDHVGLDATDRKVILALCTTFAGKTVGLSPLAQFCDLDERTLSDEVEPYLSRSALVLRTQSGRMAGPKAYALAKEMAS